MKQQKSGDWFWVSLGAGIVMMVGVLIFLLLPGDETPAIPETAVAPEPTAAESAKRFQILQPPLQRTSDRGLDTVERRACASPRIKSSGV